MKKSEQIRNNINTTLLQEILMKLENLDKRVTDLEDAFMTKFLIAKENKE